MKLKALNLINKYRFFDFFVSFLGRGFGGVLNLVFILLAAKFLGSEKFGLFALSITVMQIALQFAGQGIDTVLVRFYVFQVHEETKKEALILKSCLYLRILLTVVTVGVGILLSELYITYTGRVDLRMPLLLGFVGCGFASFWYYLLAIIQAKEKFVSYSILSSMVNVMKIIFLIVLVVLHYQHSLFNLLSVYFSSFVLGMIIAVFFIPRNVLAGSGNLRQVTRNVFGYGKWIIMSSLVSILYNRIDILILTSFRSIEEVGYYSAAGSFIIGLDIIIVALFTVFLPTASKIKNYVDAVRYLKFSSVISLAVLSVLLVLYVFSDYLILSIIGDSYQNSVRVFKIIFPGFLFYLFTFPWALVIYSYNKPHLLFMSDVAVLFFNLAGGLIFIPSFGMIGASWVCLFSRVLNSAIIVSLLATESRKIKLAGQILHAPMVVR